MRRRCNSGGGIMPRMGAAASRRKPRSMLRCAGCEYGWMARLPAPQYGAGFVASILPSDAAVFAEPFGGVHRRIGVLHQGVGIGAVLGV